MIFRKIIGCLYILSFAACVKKGYEGPPDTSGYDPHLSVNTTIAQLNAMPRNKAVTDDMVIAGLVVMDDKSGNYFRKIVIQDSSGGVEVLLGQSNLYNDFPVGRKIYIQCKGLYPGDYNGNPQLGYTPDRTGSLSDIPALLISDFVVKANYPNAIIPDTLTIAQLSKRDATKYLNTLIAIKDVEFADEDTGIPYAQQASIASATSLRIKDCKGDSVMLRTSGNARFQPYLTPRGNGVLTGVLTRYNDEWQLSIRDTTDVRFSNVRCDGSSGGAVLFSEDFSGLADHAEVTLPGWTNFAEAGNKKYAKGAFYADVYAKITAHGGVVPEVVKSWLITPAIDMAGKSHVKLTFRTKNGFDNGATLKAYASVDYAGTGDPNLATWTDLGAAISMGNADNYATEWTVANILLHYTTPVYIAFKYEGGGQKTTTFELGYIKVTSD